MSKWLDIGKAKVAALASHNSVESVGSHLTKQDNKDFEEENYQMLQGWLQYYSAPALLHTLDMRPLGGSMACLGYIKGDSRKNHPAKNNAFHQAGS